MKASLILLFCVFAIVSLTAEIIFHDDFNRSDGVVGNGWTNVGTSTTSIENGTMKIIADNGKGIRREFPDIASGVYYVQYDWLIQSNDWYADAFPTGVATHLIVDDAGNLCYDVDGTMSNPIILQNIAFNSWNTVKLKVDLDTDRFSVWLNGVLCAENIQGIVVNSFYRFTFRAGLGANVVQYVDNFFVYDDVPPAIPTGFTAMGNVNEIILYWDEAANQDFLTYKIYRDTTSPATTMLIEISGSETQFIDTNAEANTDYFYRIKAVSLQTNESEFSNEVSSHLQPQAVISPIEITFNVGYGYSDSTYITITNTGNYPLNWNISGCSGDLDGLIAQYSFNGNSVNETGNQEFDAINNDAVFTSDRFGTPNSALDFNGSSSFLYFNNNIQFESEMTISCWVLQRTISYAPGIVSRYGGWSLFGDTENQPQVRFYSSSGATLIAPYTTNSWHHIVATVHSNTKSIFMDGILYGQNECGGTSNYGEDMYIGKYYSGGYYWDGKIDDIMIYNRALSENEVMQIYSEQSTSGSYAITDKYRFYPLYGTIEPNDQQSIQITLYDSDLSVGSYIDTLFIATNDVHNPNHEILVTVNVLPPVPQINLGAVTINVNQENRLRESLFSIENVGQGKLTYQLKGKDSLSDYNPSNPIVGYSFLGEHNYHHYYLSDYTSSWTQANASCTSIGGHLATISSMEENSFLASRYSQQAWIGLTDQEQEGVFKWVTSEPLIFTRWWPEQPDNYEDGEDYAEINYGGIGFWNDQKNDHSFDGIPIKHILEIDNPYTQSILTFIPNTGILEANSNYNHTLQAYCNNLQDGVYDTAILLISNAIVPNDSIEIPVRINVDITPPMDVQGLHNNIDQTDANQIALTWSANAVSDSVHFYKIYRKGRDETSWRLLSTVNANTLSYIDRSFTPLDSTFVYYRVTAIDWVGNESEPSEEIIASLFRFRAPDNLTLDIINNRHVELNWSPVTETLYGTTGTPSCYVIYKSERPLPLSDFDFLAISTTNNFTHQWAAYFQPVNRLFYIVTAYGGDLGETRALVSSKPDWKYGELHRKLINPFKQ